MSNLITHDGKKYDLNELAFFMDDVEREFVHGMIPLHCTDQEYWDTFAMTFPHSSYRIVQRAKVIQDA